MRPLIFRRDFTIYVVVILNYSLLFPVQTTTQTDATTLRTVSSRLRDSALTAIDPHFAYPQREWNWVPLTDTESSQAKEHYLHKHINLRKSIINFKMLFIYFLQLFLPIPFTTIMNAKQMQKEFRINRIIHLHCEAQNRIYHFHFERTLPRISRGNQGEGISDRPVAGLGIHKDLTRTSFNRYRSLSWNALQIVSWRFGKTYLKTAVKVKLASGYSTSDSEGEG